MPKISGNTTQSLLGKATESSAFATLAEGPQVYSQVQSTLSSVNDAIERLRQEGILPSQNPREFSVVEYIERIKAETRELSSTLERFKRLNRFTSDEQKDLHEHLRQLEDIRDYLTYGVKLLGLPEKELRARDESPGMWLAAINDFSKQLPPVLNSLCNYARVGHELAPKIPSLEEVVKGLPSPLHAAHEEIPLPPKLAEALARIEGSSELASLRQKLAATLSRLNGEAVPENEQTLPPRARSLADNARTNSNTETLGTVSGEFDLEGRIVMDSIALPLNASGKTILVNDLVTEADRTRVIDISQAATKKSGLKICSNSSTGALTVRVKCKKIETQLTSAMLVGPTGPQGSTGATGAQGPTR